jgi:hypothetical protein
MTKLSAIVTLPERSGSSRRNFLGKVGAVGLAVAANVMVQTDTAWATYTCGCCELAYPNGHSVSWCVQAGDWLWYCGGNCTCCEAYWANSSDSNCC